MNIKITPRLAAITIALAVPACLVIAAGPAQASVEICNYKFNTDGVNIRSGPGTGYSANGQGQKGQPFTSDPAKSSGVWVKGVDGDTGISGWVDDAYLTDEGCKTVN
jgi:uncharacterized protein YraI